MENDAQNQEIKTKKSGTFILKVVIVTLIFLIAATSIVGFMSYSEYQKMKDAVDSETIYENIYINDISVGTLTKDEAIKKVSSEFVPSFVNKSIILKEGDKVLEIKYNDLNPLYDFIDVVDEAYNYARDGSIKERYNKVMQLKDTPHKITYEPDYTFDDTTIPAQIAEFTADLVIDPINATMSRQNGQFVITEGKNGRIPNNDETFQKVQEKIQEVADGEVEVVFDIVEPKFKPEDYANAQSLIGTGSSVYTGSLDNPRNINVSNAASKINQVVLFPGEVFSTNAMFGEMSIANGYRKAPVIIGGKLVDDIGGGVCQVSSTLYNALLQAELKIVERQNHSLKVGYMDYGFDATLAGDYIDLKFENDTKYPLLVEAYLEGNKVITNIYGNEVHNPGRKLVFQKALIETVPPGAEKVTQDPNLPTGQRVVDLPALTGYKYRVYKIIYENDVEVEKVVVNDSYYKPRKAEVRVGTAKSVSNVPNEINVGNLPEQQSDFNLDVLADPVEVFNGYVTPDL